MRKKLAGVGYLCSEPACTCPPACPNLVPESDGWTCGNGYIESWGRGIQEIRDICKENGNPSPEFKVDADAVFVTFYPLEKISKTNASDGQEKVHEKFTESADGSQKKFTENVNGSQKILELIKTNENLTTQDMADKRGISRRAVAKQIARMQEDGIIRRVGADKGGHWEVLASIC